MSAGYRFSSHLISKQFIRKREVEITGHVPVLGFRSHLSEDELESLEK